MDQYPPEIQELLLTSKALLKVIELTNWPLKFKFADENGLRKETSELTMSAVEQYILKTHKQFEDQVRALV